MEEIDEVDEDLIDLKEMIIISTRRRCVSENTEESTMIMTSRKLKI